MSRFAAAVVLTVVLLQAVGFSLAADLPCPVQCEDDGPDGQCPPTCEDCLCCAHLRATFFVATAVTIPVEVGVVGLIATDSDPPQAELQEILRIPKSRA